MNRQIFLPPLDSRWRLAADWTPPEAFHKDHDNTESLWGYARYGQIDAWKKATGRDTGPGSDWVPDYHAWWAAEVERLGVPVFLSGTVLQIERYHVSRSGENQITCKILASPNMRLHPKKLKGQMRGAGRIYFTLDQFNTLPELEQADDIQDLR